MARYVGDTLAGLEAKAESEKVESGNGGQGTKKAGERGFSGWVFQVKQPEIRRVRAHGRQDFSEFTGLRARRPHRASFCMGGYEQPRLSPQLRHL